jgi:hypothetical protein
MEKNDIKMKLVVFLIIVVLYVLLTSPKMYELTDKLFTHLKLSTVDSKGPTYAGIVIHGVVLALILVSLHSL